MARMTGFIFQDEYLTKVVRLSDQELGRLVRALATYHATGETQELAGRESVAFDFIKDDIDRIDGQYAAKCETLKNNKKQMISNDNKCQQMLSNDVQDKDKDKDKNIEKENHLTVVKEKRRFSPPTLDEVKKYCAERHNDVDPQRFIDFYASKGWVVGKSPMRDWKAAVRTWEQRDSSPSQPVRQVTAQQYSQRTYTEDELEDRTLMADILAEAAVL